MISAESEALARGPAGLGDAADSNRFYDIYLMNPPEIFTVGLRLRLFVGFKGFSSEQVPPSADTALIIIYIYNNNMRIIIIYLPVSRFSFFVL